MLSRVPISRLPNQHTVTKAGRTGRACDECRFRKAKCDGTKPVCVQCARSNVPCVYSETKRKREKAELERMTRKAENLAKLLQQISQEVDTPLADKIKKRVQLLLGDSELKHTSSDHGSTSSCSGASLDATEVLDEDPNRSRTSRATGYLGNHSEVSWMRSLNMQSDLENGEENSPSHRTPPTSSVNYHVESPIYPACEVDDIYALPPIEVAEQLFAIFRYSVYPSLPIIRLDLFTHQFVSFYSGQSSHPGRKWLAVLNLIFAISSKLCQISGQDTQNSGHQFFSRAQILNISESVVQDHEDLQQVQIEALAAFYLLASMHVNRAWKMIGTAARAGVSLGLHLRATHNDLNAQALEARHRLFWSIFSLENLLSTMTGRASCLRESTFSAPPPLASEDMHPFTNNALREGLDQASKNLPMIWTIDQDHKQLESQRALTETMKATDELYFFCLIDLILILHTASARIYSKEALKLGWDEIQSRIDFYNNIMLDWRAGLPDSMNFDALDSVSGLSTNEAYRVCLALHYHSARIIINRPCLTWKKGKEGFQGHLSRTRRDIETTCLESALAILSILPDQPNTIWYRSVTWWSVLHYLVQSTAIFLINISYAYSSEDLNRRPRRSSETVNPKIILTATEKALRWLYCLGQTDESARKAFNLCNDCVRRMKSKYAKLSDLVTPNHTSDSTGYQVPTDESHQQSRCRENVSYDQFAGSVDFGFDDHVNVGSVSPGMWYSNELEFVKPSIRIDTLRDGTDMADYVPDAASPTFDDILQGLA